ncbi:hypothetical protein [Butyricimonas sp.]|uniref:hypothetical protein n=1 Tax=Butyricimonas sp. TaxID=1969738 RepID=UPI0025BE751B|nr:hypothetical protein [Butyricimonas sp.]
MIVIICWCGRFLRGNHVVRALNGVEAVKMSRDAFDSDRISTMDAGCNVFLAKPLERKQLLEIFSMKW